MMDCVRARSARWRRGNLAKSTRYVCDDAARQVSAAALLVAYGQIEMLRLLAAGLDRADAYRRSWLLFGELARAVGHKTIEPARQVDVPTNCIQESARDARDALSLDWKSFTVAHGTGPWTFLHPCDVERIGFMLDTLRRVAAGGETLLSARQAFDASRGRPRHRGRPADPEWLDSEIELALTRSWWALVQAHHVTPWLELREGWDDDHRPSVDDAIVLPPTSFRVSPGLFKSVKTCRGEGPTT